MPLHEVRGREWKHKEAKEHQNYSNPCKEARPNSIATQPRRLIAQAGATERHGDRNQSARDLWRHLPAYQENSDRPFVHGPVVSVPESTAGGPVLPILRSPALAPLIDFRRNVQALVRSRRTANQPEHLSNPAKVGMLRPSLIRVQ